MPVPPASPKPPTRVVVCNLYGFKAGRQNLPDNLCIGGWKQSVLKRACEARHLQDEGLIAGARFSLATHIDLLCPRKASSGPSPSSVQADPERHMTTRMMGD